MALYQPSQYDLQQIQAAATRGDEVLFWHGNAQAATTPDGMAIAVAHNGGSAMALAKPRIVERHVTVEVERPRSRRKCCTITLVILALLVIAGVATAVVILKFD
ncbi:hypothetical protein EDD37DRAFT_646304 [Exophiala viscosa]|uniref:Uncharacterized protein n=1 Tax=Exophiala viscosa TaxID=2486360 RepID=A0AAN6IHN1_9EURO|nr:hypothetical protein EDD36DRAFT_459148 [Exophiala viscosa]KAI1626593.1 hypothetical protein EDD37DRAFT_646304 [Exophiala viscosa]